MIATSMNCLPHRLALSRLGCPWSTRLRATWVCVYFFTTCLVYIPLLQMLISSFAYVGAVDLYLHGCMPIARLPFGLAYHICWLPWFLDQGDVGLWITSLSSWPSFFIFFPSPIIFLYAAWGVSLWTSTTYGQIHHVNHKAIIYDYFIHIFVFFLIYL